MRRVSLPNGIPDASVLGFGCAALMGSASRRDSLAALSAACDAGINFFDTARSYGYGESEALLGEFFAGRRTEVVLCTKFGILPETPGWKHSLKPLARAALKVFPGLRHAARTHTGPMLRANQFSVASLRSSLETSLRQLRTDYVDILLMHAAPIAVLSQLDLLEEMERLVAEGKVRMAGVSGDLEVISATVRDGPQVLRTAQLGCNVANFLFLEQLGYAKRAAGSKLFLVGNHPFGGPAGVRETQRRVAALHGAFGLSKTLRAKLDPNDPHLLPDVLLNAVLVGTGIDAVVPAMLRPEHVRANCRAIETCRFTADELTQIRHNLST
jgi:aryl-alcohol dehydrogenase-like predicted oxidoreductase